MFIMRWSCAKSMFFNSSLFSLFTLGSSNQVPPYSRSIYVQIVASRHCLSKEQTLQQMLQHLCFLASTYCTIGTIITFGLYIFTPFLKAISLFSRRFFQKILALCTVSIQARVMMACVRYVEHHLVIQRFDVQFPH